MPTGTPYNSCILPYRIRVDDFATPANQDPNASPLLHLLTHTHSDHINGLSAKSFGYKVYCSEDAKQMLLRHEVYAERELQALELRSEKIQTYSHLRINPFLYPDGTMYYTGSRDLLAPLPLNTPTRVELTAEETVVITLLDANHCPGAVMFLIEGPKGAVLHTGDFRAEPWFLESLTRNPLLQRYLSPRDQEYILPDQKQPLPTTISTTLEAIYLDTASALSDLQIVTKDCATTGLIELMKCFSDSVYFFINSWTWGYEDILKAIAREFQSQIHVDRYKYSIYHHISDPFLGLITTRDPSSTRFHACERFHRCSFVAVDNVDNDPESAYPNSTSHMGKRVVYINPVTMGSENWDLYLKDTKARLVAGEEINNLLVPLSRHSTLPELQAFVKLFRPKRIVPNTLDPRLHGLDWNCLDRMFSHCLHPSAQASSASNSQLRLGVIGHDRLTVDAQNDVDVALKNLVGDGASDAAQRWADHGKLLKKFAILRDYLGEEGHDVIDKLLGTAGSSRPIYAEPSSDPPERTLGDKGKGKEINAAGYYARESEEDTDISDDERGKTAHMLFAGLAGIDAEDKENMWWFSPASSQVAEQDVSISQDLLNASSKGKGKPVGNGAWRLNRLTPTLSSPFRASPNQSVSKSCNVTPRQSQLGPSARKKAAAKKKASQVTPSKPNLSRLITRSTEAMVGAGHSLSSPICLLSSSPAVSAKGRPSHVVRPAPPKSHALSLTTKALKSTPATTSVGLGGNVLIRGTALKIYDHQTENIASSSAPPPKSFILNTSPNMSAKRKHLIDERPPLTPDNSKKRCGVTSTINPQPAITMHKSNDVVVTSLAVSSKEAINSNQENFIPTEREKLAIQRMDIAQQLAKAYPHLVAPSYEKKRDKQLAKLTKKKRGRQVADAVDGGESVNTMNRKLVQTPTIFSFETVDDDDGGMDWNRSRQLADDLREAIAEGRRPTLPTLKCAQSPSPSP